MGHIHDPKLIFYHDIFYYKQVLGTYIVYYYFEIQLYLPMQYDLYYYYSRYLL